MQLAVRCGPLPGGRVVFRRDHLWDAEAIQKVMELARRCAERPEGLSFVTAEAGLIPRHAEHREFEQSLIQIAQALDYSSI